MPQDPGESTLRKAGTNGASNRSTGSTLSRRLSTLLPGSRRSTEPPTKLTKPKNEFGLNTVYKPGDGTKIIADFVFVHGLGGGSSTTWCLKQNLEYFWPKEWLPRDPDFEGVRVHSFGYNANWATWLKNPLDVHAFGQSLVEELLSHPDTKGQDVPIVLIGHSMGGLVIKQACILSKTNPDFAHVANRLHSFYFLGTPHRGSNLARVLKNLLRLSGRGRRAYVSSLETKSEMIRILSDAFRVHYSGIHLHTFYESQPTPPVGLIVDVESATLGYAEERLQLMNANHRNLARFGSVHDSNYRSLRNRLASTVQQVRDEPQEHQATSLGAAKGSRGALPAYQSAAEQMELIGTYLSVHQDMDDILSSFDDRRLKGSCSWLPAKASFQEWRYSEAPRYFWLKGAAASGKSTITSYIVEYLADNPICYYFFKRGEETALNLSNFLRSMAYQMAKANPTIRDALYRLSQQGPPIDIRNQRLIWHNIFTGCVFHTKLHRPHFWVIDALDEAADRGPLDEYFLMLSKIDSNISLKIFITSQPSYALDTLFTQLPTISQLITPEDLRPDIQRYVESWSANLPVADSQEQEKLVRSIVDMSGSSFLWAVLVIQQLQEVVLVEEVHEVLREVPQKMGELYLNNLRRMESARSKSPAKHIITWTICAIHPLTVNQMKDAIKLSLGATLARDLRTNIQSICGQFLYLDNNSRIRVVHDTARAFLTNPDLDSEFRVDSAEDHGLIASACLKYLLSDELKHFKGRRSLVASGSSKISIADYACLHFSDHLLRTSGSSDELFELLTRFFNTNVLSWIERVAQLKDMECLNQTSRHLSSYMSHRAKHVPLLPSDLNAWTVDLPRIVTRFGAILLSDPAAIHTLIPPFCPRNSAIYRRFGYAEDGVKLVGVSASGWDNRIYSISYHETYTTVVATRDQLFAVGLSDGTVKVYRSSTCEELLTLAHGESVGVLEFGFTSKYLASAGLRRVRLWDAVAGHQLFDVATDSQTLALAFNEIDTCLTVASRDKRLSAYQIPDGARLSELSWTDTFIEPKDADFARLPTAIQISSDQQVMAIVYRGKPVQLWSLENQRSVGACIRPAVKKHGLADHIVHSVIFTPGLENPRLLVSYWDAVVTAFDSITCRPTATAPIELDRLAIAPNGKTFAGGDGTGGIRIFDLETLQFLHRIVVHDEPVISLRFTSDSLRILDSRGTQVNVWEPLVLVNQDSDAQSSGSSDTVYQVVDDSSVSVVDQSATITSLYCCEDSDIAFCGRNNGRVDTCNLDSPESTMRNLYNHRGSFTSVTCIDWSYKSRIAASADSSGSFRIMQITTGSRREWGAELLVEARVQPGCIVRQILVHPDGTFVLVSSAESHSVWSVTTKKQVASIPRRGRSDWKWFIRHSTPSQLLLFEDKVLKLFNWSDLSPLVPGEIPVQSMGGEKKHDDKDITDSDAISISSDGDDIVMVQKLHTQQSLHVLPSPASAAATMTKVHVFDLSSLGPPPISSSGDIPTPLSPVANPVSRPNPASASHNSDRFVTPTPPSLPPPGAISPISDASAHRRSSVRDVADLPEVESMIGTVKRFRSWFLIFLSIRGWVCSIELDGRQVLDTFRKHFFVPSVWRTVNSSPIAKVRRNQDIIFVHHDAVIVVKNGLDNGEHVPFL